MDLGIGEVDLRDAQLRLRRRQLRRLRTLGGGRIVDRGPLAGRRAQQRLRACELDIGVGEPGAGVGDRGLLLRHRGLERRALQAVQQVALLHLGAFGEQALLEERGDAGGQRDAVHRLDAADEFGCLGDRLARRAHHADRGRAARRLRLRGGEPRKGRKQRDEAAQRHRPSFSGLMRRGAGGGFNREGEARRSTGAASSLRAKRSNLGHGWHRRPTLPQIASLLAMTVPV